MFGHNEFNWNQIQHLMAEGDYGWKQTGNKDLTYSAKDPDCLNTLKSNVEIIGPDGLPINVTSNVPDDNGVVPTWENIPKGSKIKWMAKTLAEDKDPAADRVQVELTVMNSKYVAGLVSGVIDNLSQAEQDMFLTDVNGITEIITERTMENMKFELMMTTIYSTVVNTNAEGYYEGEIPIASQWPTGSYSMLIHYGYHGQSESSDTSKMIDFWVYEMGTLIVELIVTAIIFLFCPPCGVGVAVALFTVVMIADIAIMYSQYMKTAFGMTGLNQYDCAFPDGGWNHLYAFGYDTEVATEEIEGQASGHTVAILQNQTDIAIAQYGLVGVTAAGTLIVGLILISLAKIKDKKKRRKESGS